MTINSSYQPKKNFKKHYFITLFRVVLWRTFRFVSNNLFISSFSVKFEYYVRYVRYSITEIIIAIINYFMFLTSLSNVHLPTRRDGIIFFYEIKTLSLIYWLLLFSKLGKADVLPRTTETQETYEYFSISNINTVRR